MGCHIIYSHCIRSKFIPGIPFINQMGLTAIGTMILIIIISYRKEKVKMIERDSIGHGIILHSPIFNISFIIYILASVLYAIHGKICLHLIQNNRNSKRKINRTFKFRLYCFQLTDWLVGRDENYRSTKSIVLPVPLNESIKILKSVCFYKYSMTANYPPPPLVIAIQVINPLSPSIVDIKEKFRKKQLKSIFTCMHQDRAHDAVSKAVASKERKISLKTIGKW